MVISKSTTTQRTARSSGMLFAGAVLAIALLSIAQLMWRELTTFKNDYTHVDEIFFAVCAARGLTGGDIPVSGCHDNKAPLIYLLYQAIELLSGRFSLIGIKIAGTLFSLSAIASVALVAHRIGGALASLVGAALAAQAMAIHPELLAFKTELVGTIFMLVGAAYLLSWRRVPSMATLFLAGLFFGFSIMTKQTFAFGVFGVWIWLLSCPVAPMDGGLSVRAGRWLLFNSALMAPMLAFMAVFSFRGQSLDFLGSVFLHAATYGTGGTALSWSERAWKVGWLMQHFELVYPLSLTFTAALAHWLWIQSKGQTIRVEQGTSLGLLFSLSIGMAFVPVISRQYFQPHLLPAWLLMAVAAGASVAAWLNWGFERYGRNGEWQVATGAACLLITVLMAVNSWYINGDASKREASKQHILDTGSRIPDAQGSYGYVLGIRPEFYFFNGIVPASDVLYPEALIRAGKAVAPAGSENQENLLTRLHSTMQAHASQRLMEDFARTPPTHIYLIDKWARKTDSVAATDVEVLSEYLRIHCSLFRTVAGKPYQAGRLYTCKGNSSGSTSTVTATLN